MSMTVLMFGSLPPPYGGVSVHVKSLCKELSKCIKVIVVNDKPSCDTSDLGETLIYFPMTTISGLKSKKSLSDLLRTIEMNIKTYQLGGIRTSTTFLKTSTKYIKLNFNPLREVIFFPLLGRILKKHAIDLIHTHHAGLRTLRGIMTKELWKLRVPLVVTVHGGEFYREDRNLVMTKFVLEEASKIIVTSEKVKNLVKALDIDLSKLVKIPNGVDTNYFRPLNLKKSGKTIKLLFVGRISRIKGVHDLMESFKSLAHRYENLKLILVSSGGTPLALKLIRKFELEGKVEVIEGVPHKDMVYVYNSADIFVLPSRFEAFGMSILEAMSCGLPVVTTYQYNNKHEFVKDRVNGFLVQVGNVADLTDKLSRLIEDEHLRQRLGKKARETVVKEFNWHLIAEKVIDVYSKLLTC